MADENKVEVVFGSNIQGLMSGLKEATSGVQGATQSMQSAFGGLSSMMGQFSKGFAVVTGVLAGGAAFKGAIDSTIHWTMEVKKLSIALGTNMTDASAWAVAIHTLGIDAETLTGVTQRLQMRIATSADAFKTWKVSITDAQGGALPMAAIIQNVAGRYNELGTQQEKNAMMAATLGRGWMAMLPIVRMTSERLHEAAVEAKAFGLEVGNDGVAQAREYKEALAKIQLISTGLANSIGRELIPILKDLGKWFGESGPGVIGVFRDAIGWIKVAFFAMKASVEVTVIAITTYLMSMWEVLKTVVIAFYRFQSGDFKGAYASMKEGWNGLKNEVTAGAEEMGLRIKNALESGKKALSGDSKFGGKDEPAGANPIIKDSSAGKVASRMKEWEAILKVDEEKGSEQSYKLGQFYEKDLQAELKYWQEKKSITGLSKEEEAAVTRKVAETEMQIHKQSLESKLASLRVEETEMRTNLQAKLEIVRQEMSMYREGSKDYENARRKVVEVEREIQKQVEALKLQGAAVTKTSALMGVQAEEAAMAQRVAMGQATEQEQLTAQAGFLAQKLQAEKDYILAEMEMSGLTLEQKAALNAKLLEVEQKYQLDRQQIRYEAQLKDKENAEKMFSPISQAWQESMTAMLAGTMKFSDGVKNIWKSFGKVLDQVIIQMITEWVKGEMTKMAITAANWIKEVVMGQSAAASGIAASKAEAAGEIPASASMLAVNAAASVAAIPFVGWAMAPGVFASMMALGMSALATASAEGGWDLPKGSNPVTQLHSGEMVLPQQLADRVRNMTDGGGGTGSQTFAPSFTVHAIDSKSLERALRDNNSAVGKALRDYGRKFGGR